MASSRICAITSRLKMSFVIYRNVNIDYEGFKIMSNECFKHFTGWCKSFTRTEIYLCILQALLLVTFFICLTFLILHLYACFKPDSKYDLNRHTITEEPFTDEGEASSVKMATYTPVANATTKHCTWEPSRKTKAVTRYFDRTTIKSNEKDKVKKEKFESSKFLSLEDYDSVRADNVTKKFILALVKVKSRNDMIFGCTLTIVSEYWTLTAASCIEAIEEVDALDSFVMMEGLGEGDDTNHEVSDIFIHPRYQGTNYSYDLAALKSEDSILRGDQLFLTMATVVDYLMIPIGERLTVLGHGNYR